MWEWSKGGARRCGGQDRACQERHSLSWVVLPPSPQGLCPSGAAGQGLEAAGSSAHLAMHALGSCLGCRLSTLGVSPSVVWGPWPAGGRLCFLSGNLPDTQVSLPHPKPAASSRSRVPLCFGPALSSSTDITCPSVCPPALSVGRSGSSTTPSPCVCVQSLPFYPPLWPLSSHP